MSMISTYQTYAKVGFAVNKRTHQLWMILTSGCLFLMILSFHSGPLVLLVFTALGLSANLPAIIGMNYINSFYNRHGTRATVALLRRYNELDWGEPPKFTINEVLEEVKNDKQKEAPHETQWHLDDT